jgi:glycine cleavage system aminomethyltransferase T
MTAFAKCRIKGPKAEEFLDFLVANKLPKKNWKNKFMSCAEYERWSALRIYNNEGSRK